MTPLGVLALAALGAVLGLPLTAIVERVTIGPTRLPAARAVASAGCAALFSLVAVAIGPRPELLAFLVLAAGSVVLAIVDVVEKRLPNAVLLVCTVLVGAALAGAAVVEGAWPRAGTAAVAAVAMFAVYLLLAVISPAGMGMGDVKLAGLLGLALGYQGWQPWLLGLVAGFVVGATASLIALALRRVSMSGHLPFGPSMLAGAFIALAVAG